MDLDPVQMCSLKLGDLQGPVRGRKLSTAAAGPQTCGPLTERADPGSVLLLCSVQNRARTTSVSQNQESGSPETRTSSALAVSERASLIIDYLSVLLVLSIKYFSAAETAFYKHKNFLT